SVVRDFCLGQIVDAETDGQPSTTATGDDANPAAADDEDGVTLPAALVAGQSVTAQVFLTAAAGTPARLNAWVDFNRDGDWADAGEQIATNLPLVPGNNNVNFSVPANAVPGTSYARFRLNHTGEISFSGFGGDGEVEDYQVTLAAPQDF